MNTNANEPAFPFACQGPTTAPECYYGLTKRELFAAMAMHGILANPMTTGSFEIFAKDSIQYADALLRALEHMT